MQNKRGGSRGSDVINAQVTPETYEIMSQMHTNFVGGKCKCQKCRIKGGSGSHIKRSRQGGRTGIATTAGPAVPTPTAITSETITTGGVTPAIKHIRELFDGTNYKLSNKTGGSKSRGSSIKHVAKTRHTPHEAIPAIKRGKAGKTKAPQAHIKRGGAPTNVISLDYSSIATTGNISDASSRAINPISTKILANNSY